MKTGVVEIIDIAPSHIITKAAFRDKAAERNEFKISVISAGVRGTANRRNTTVDHFIDISHLRISGMKSIFNFFIMVGKNSL